MTRQPIPRRIRFVVLERDGFACQYCGAKAPDAILHVDHVIPHSKGGQTDPGNLVTACEDCNIGKADGLLSDSPDHVRDAAEVSFDRAGVVRALVREANERTAVNGEAADAPEAVLQQITSEAHALTVSMAASRATQTFIADAVGISDGYLSYMKTGGRPIPEKLVAAFCAATGTNLLRQYRNKLIEEGERSEIERLAQIVRGAAA